MQARLGSRWFGWVLVALGAAGVVWGTPGDAAREQHEAAMLAGQAAVEAVYAADRGGAEPSEAALRQVAEGRRRDVLRTRRALRERYGLVVDAADVQLELDRLGRTSRDPERLARLFAALDDDPALVAELLVRPLVEQRWLSQAFAADEQRRREELAAVDPIWRGPLDLASFRALASEDAHRVWTVDRRDRGVAPDADREMDPEAFAALKADLARELGFESLVAGQVSPLIERKDAFLRVAVEVASDERVEVFVQRFDRRSLDEWLDDAPTGRPSGAPDALDLATLEGDFTLPDLADGIIQIVCPDDTWRGPLQPQPIGRSGHTAIWTGSEMIVWGGTYINIQLDDGAIYDPVFDEWRPMSRSGAPSGRNGHTAVWTGSEMIVWGGDASFSDELGAIYDLATDTWRPMSEIGAPFPRSNHVAVWTGSKMLIWGSDVFGEPGGIYDPVTDSWSTITLSGAPEQGRYSTAFWTGSEMIVWGGGESIFDFTVDEGGLYDPATDTWTTMDVAPLDSRARHTAVWTGSELIVHGGLGFSFGQSIRGGGGEEEGPLSDGAVYDPVTDSWTYFDTFFFKASATAVWDGFEMLIYGGDEFSDFGMFSVDPFGFPDAKSFSPLLRQVVDATSVYTGTDMIVFGGIDVFSFSPQLSEGFIFNPVFQDYLTTFNPPLPEPRTEATAVWSGAEMLLWGGSSNFFGTSVDGYRYDPAFNIWNPMATTNQPAGRTRHRATWTGDAMFVWGGFGNNTYLGDGALYDPATDSWTTVSATGAPTARQRQSQVWTGDRVLVWGGFGGGTDARNDGALFDPVANSWTPTSQVGAPTPRANFPGIWTGTELIVWAGFDGISGIRSDGARYDPATEVWTPMSTTGAPPPTSAPAAHWTGNRALIWSGSASTTEGEGGLYDPVTDTWEAMPTVGAPLGQFNPVSVWTGEELIVWGGRPTFSSPRLDTGARFDPVAGTWTDTSPFGAPAGRDDHVAVWSGSEMLIWGGEGNGPGTSLEPAGAAYCAESSACTPTDWFRDVDGDGVGDANDSVSECTQPAGFVAASGDCDDANGAVFATPGETGTLLLSHDALGSVTTLSWAAPVAPGGELSALTFDVLSSVVADDFGAGATCAVTATANTTAIDANDPASGTVVYFLARAANACLSGVGPLGNDSAGTPRLGRTCP